MVLSELIAVYLFLGGAAAGSFLFIAFIEVMEDMSCVIEQRSPRLAIQVQHNSLYLTRRHMARLVYAMSFVLLMSGMFCLLADLGKPQAFYYLFLYPTTSLVSLGSYALAGLFVCIALALLDTVLEKGLVFKKITFIAKVLGILFAVFVMLYTGLLLKSLFSVCLWQSIWLPVLFVFSALSCGCGIVLVCAYFSEGYKGIAQWSHFFSCIDLVCIILESISACRYFLNIYTSYGIEPLMPIMFSQESYVFWLGFIGLGLIIPFVTEVYFILSRRALQRSFVVVLAALVLVGGLCLRLILVSAGVQYVY